MADVLTHFRQVRTSGDGWTARCPAHTDTRSSLSIGHGDTQPWVLRCHAGCSTEAILAAAGLTLADILAPRSNGHASRPQIVATYDYRDETGALLSQAVRFDPKDFRQRRPDGNGGFAWDLKDVRRVLYCLPELQGQSVAYVVEGEKDVATVQGLGLAATCNAGGASKNPDRPKWREDYTAQLTAAGVRSVVVMPDNDEPGRVHATAIARSCVAAGLHVKVVALPDLPPRGDVTDWIAAGHTREDLVALVKASPLWSEASQSERPAASETGAVVVRLSEVTPVPVRYLWQDRIAVGKLNLLVGDPGLGKSFISYDVAARVSTGAAWPDAGHAPRGSVVLLSAEDALADTVRPRLDALSADVTRIHALTAVRVADGPERQFSLAQDVAQLEAVLATTGATLVIIDPLSAYLGGKADSYKDPDVRGLLAPLAALRGRRDPAVRPVRRHDAGRQQP